MDFATTYDAVVVGGGIIGASIFFHLSQLTPSVCLIEADTIANGSTKYYDGVVRCFHTDNELMQRAVISWKYYKYFTNHTGIDCPLVTTGLLYFPKPRYINYAKQVADQEDIAVPMLWMDVEQLQEKFGKILNSNLYGAIYEPFSGYMDPIKITKAWVEAAVKNGGQVIEKTALTDLIYNNNKLVGIETTKGVIKAKKVIIASGSQTPELLDKLEIAHHLYSQMTQIERRMPIVPIKNQPAYIDDCHELSGRPEVSNDSIYIKYPTRRIAVGMGKYDDLQSDLIANYGTKRWRWLKSSTLIDRMYVADCYTRHGSGYVGSIENKNLFLAAGFNGDSFKMAPWVGQQLASMIKL